jgi:hypothetical protein
MLAVAMFSTAGNARGQNPASQQTTAGFATVNGVVVDSVHGGRLAGASVTVEGSLRQAISDSSGRFRIDSVEPGQRRFGLFHPLLDSLGFGVSSPPLTLKAGDTLLMAMATPSARTVIGRFCLNAAPAADGEAGPVLVTGKILDAETEAPVAGAHVTLSWTRSQYTSAGVHRARFTRDSITGRAGEFHFCGLRGGLRLIVRAGRSAANAAGSDADADAVYRQLDMGDHLVGIVVLHLPTAGVAAASQRTASLSGRVTQPTGAPAVGARVLVLGSRDSVATDESGAFTLHGLSPGTRTLVVRAIGFEPVTTPVEITARETRKIDVPLGMRIGVLDSIRVIAQLQAGYGRVGFNKRRQSGAGYYLTAEDIDKIQATEFLDLLMNVPGVRVDYGGSGAPYLRAARGGGCVSYLVDGFPYREMVRGDIDTFIQPSEVAAIEVSPPGQVPAEDIVGSMNQIGVTSVQRPPARLGYSNAPTTGTASRPTTTSGCALVVVWTKMALGL